MKYIPIYLLLLFFMPMSVFSQVKFETIQSSKLEEKREIKIQLPEDYENNLDKTYPLFIVLDGDYMFDTVAGSVKYYSYWDDMPEAIVVGVSQLNSRYDDSVYSEQNSLPIDTGANFFEFIGLELVPYIENKYRANKFRVIVGHGETANFINYYLLKPKPLFQSYIAISPELAPNMIDFLPSTLEVLKSKIFYYLANTNNDSGSIKKMSQVLNKDIVAIENPNLDYRFDAFEGPSHYAVPTHAIPNALEKMFKVYEPISKKEYKEIILELEISPVLYLQEKYQNIEDVFGISKKIRINDYRAISSAIEKNETYEYYEELSKMARKDYPDTLLGEFYMARFYEETGEPKRAMKTYQAAYSLDEIAGVTVDDMQDRAALIKEDFGY
ncbi:alpha/beta hydrolase [Algibacter mikhailovii]|uniref:alpha/beta hydrolase n=1 Tax=Algibacter mikhailovii TaxID=425498 RepID=UPI002495A849|nr:alpha/beta hydrolase-fold protein [Algibacter mikhailovii]